MKIVLFCHPSFLASRSMPRFAQMLKTSFESRGHSVDVWSPRGRVYNWLSGSRLAKWGGYIDQYLVFPLQARRRLKSTDADTLFVFCDQALGPWVPLVRNRPHVVHVHDLLALRSALGHVPENPTALSGRLYQRYIRHGFRQARHFIAVSEKSRDDLHRFGRVNAVTSEVVYNGLNFPYAPMDAQEAMSVLQSAGLPAAAQRMLLHVGGGQWYKNLTGVILLYAKYVTLVQDPLPLWCVGTVPSDKLKRLLGRVQSNGRVLFFQNLDSRVLQAAYSYARVFLFPSLAEGFGWPLIEAQACGCPVLTTDAPPMNEVAGDAARYLPRLNADSDVDSWATQGAAVLLEILSLSAAQRTDMVERGLKWTRRFDARAAIDHYLSLYQQIFEREMQR